MLTTLGPRVIRFRRPVLWLFFFFFFLPFSDFEFCRRSPDDPLGVPPRSPCDEVESNWTSVTNTCFRERWRVSDGRSTAPRKTPPLEGKTLTKSRARIMNYSRKIARSRHPPPATLHRCRSQIGKQSSLIADGDWCGTVVFQARL